MFKLLVFNLLACSIIQKILEISELEKLLPLFSNYDSQEEKVKMNRFLYAYL